MLHLFSATPYIKIEKNRQSNDRTEHRARGVEHRAGPLSEVRERTERMLGTRRHSLERENQ